MKSVLILPLIAALTVTPAVAQPHKKTAAEYEADAARYEAEADRLLQQAGQQGQTAPAATPAPVAPRPVPAAQPAAAPATAGFLRNGTYNCILGFRVMLTLGTMTLNGNSYRFHPPQGPDTTGTFTPTAKGITWNGDVGVIKRNQIVDSNRDQGTRTDDFWLTFANDMTRGEKTSLNCKL